MFTSGQLIFAALFLLGFIIIMVFSYRKDIRLHQKYYQGSFWVLLGFLGFILMLFLIKSWLN